MSQDKNHTDLTKLDGPPGPRADVRVERERVKFGWIVKMAGFALQLRLEGSATPQGVIALAMAAALVAAFGGGFAAVLITVGTPVSAALIMGALPTVVLGTGIVLRHQAIRTADAGPTLGRRRGGGLVLDDDTGDDSNSDDSADGDANGAEAENDDATR